MKTTEFLASMLLLAALFLTAAQCEKSPPQPSPIDLLNFDLENLPSASLDYWEHIPDKLRPGSGRDCSKDGKPSRNTTEEVSVLEFVTVITQKNKSGAWHNGPDKFAKVWIDNTTGEPFIWGSYDNQVSTDVVSGRDRFPAQMRLFSDGRLRIVHSRNSWETDITYKRQGQDITLPAVTWIDVATGDTICTGSYDCDLFISGCNY